MAAPFVHELRVRYGECDPQGIVFNANYLSYFDVAFTELWREAVGPWQGLVERGIDAVVAHAELDFRAPARFDDVLALTARVVRLGETSLTTEIDAVRDGELLVAMQLRHVCVTAPTAKETIRAVPWPADIRAGLSRYVAEGEGDASPSRL
ncbi:MAG TPA: thioesterase family protein [Solirubrobacteraceae bacterium]|nr:thioesterase family protein [Solirubrobacteraceae bacterium]